MQYILNQANRQKFLPGPRPQDLPGLKILRYYVVRALYIPQVMRTELKNNRGKRERYDLGLIIVDQLTMTATALNQGGFTGWFYPSAAIRVKSKNPIRFIFLVMRKLFLSEIRIKSTRPIFLIATPSPTKLHIWWYSLNL